MSSKINGIDNRTGPVGAGRAVERVRDATSSDARTAERGSSGVHITGAARQLADLERAVKDLPVVDEARVAAIRSALEQGSYRIQPEHIADQLVQVEQALASLSAEKK